MLFLCAWTLRSHTTNCTVPFPLGSLGCEMVDVLYSTVLFMFLYCTVYVLILSLVREFHAILVLGVLRQNTWISLPLSCGRKERDIP